MVWQLLNKTATLAQGINDARFTRQFMVVVPGLIVYERLLDAFCGKLVAVSLTAVMEPPMFGVMEPQTVAKTTPQRGLNSGGF